MSLYHCWISHIPRTGIEHGNIDNTIYIVFKRYYSEIVNYMEIVQRKIKNKIFSHFDKGYYYDSKVHGKHTQEKFVFTIILTKFVHFS